MRFYDELELPRFERWYKSFQRFKQAMKIAKHNEARMISVDFTPGAPSLISPNGVKKASTEHIIYAFTTLRLVKRQKR